MHLAPIARSRSLHRPNAPARRGRRGVTLIMVAGVLAILAALGAGFYSVMLMQTKSASRYSDSVRAEMMAKAGMNDAIGRIREQSFHTVEDANSPWYPYDYMHGGLRRISFSADLSENKVDDDGDGAKDNDGEKTMPFSRALGSSAGQHSDRYILNITDAAGKINVNGCENLGVVLDNLCRVIGPPLTPAKDEEIIPRVWEWFGGAAFGTNKKDWPKSGAAGGVYGDVPKDIYYEIDGDGYPLVGADGKAIYGDGYAIAGYRSRHGRFRSLNEVKAALTVKRNKARPDLEELEREVKFSALKDHITVDSWVDTTTVCVGKFEWVCSESSDTYEIAIDRDKSWIADDPKLDPENRRGSLRGSYVSIINGHGAGQLRRIKTNGIDWIQVEKVTTPTAGQVGFVVPPGPTSSYMIVAMEDAKLTDRNGSDISSNYVTSPPAEGTLTFPRTDAGGNFVDEEKIDYASRPLCIHRSPVNINTATDKVLSALIMGINVTHGHFLSVGTDVDLQKLAASPLKPRSQWTGADSDWKIADHPFREVEPFVITPKGLKRIPADAGKLVFDLDFDKHVRAVLPKGFNMDYLNNFGTIDPKGTHGMNEAQELVFRILVARQADKTYPYLDPLTGAPSKDEANNYKRGPFVSWDDFYFRVVRPWDDSRIDTDPANARYDPRKGSVARLVMAHFNSNTDILKFNPNIEWIDRWGRNFTEMEPVMVYTNQQEDNNYGALGHGALDTLLANPNDIITVDQDAKMNDNAVPVFSRERVRKGGGGGNIFSIGPYGVKPQYMGSYVTRSFRYKSDEMIDKTDLNRSTTEFCFDSRGIFEITATGQVAKGNEILAERKLQALVKVYDVWSESTQRDFVRGHITRSPDNPTGPSSGLAWSGTIARDSSNVNSRLALTTLPEPLVPLNYQINNPKSKELVDTTGGADQKRDAWGNPSPLNVPDVVLNRVLPSGYDGQIVLATNTLRYDPSTGGDDDSFLASFNGDLDTETCRDNGREQSKSPLDCKIRVIDTIGLLGALNDIQIDSDPGLRGSAGSTTAAVPDMPPYTGSPLKLYRFNVIQNVLRGQRPDFYWNNVTCRVGDLRPDGCYVSGPGVSGNDGTLKYPCGTGSPEDSNFSLNGGPATGTGFLMTTWAKTSWHHNDSHTHEFFDCTQPGWSEGGIRAKAFWLRKQGRVQFAIAESASNLTNVGSINAAQEEMWGISGSANRLNDLMFGGEFNQNAGDQIDPDYCVFLHGGESGVPRPDPGKVEAKKSPAYRIQPFRWQFVGMRVLMNQDFNNSTNLGKLSGGGSIGRHGLFRTGPGITEDVWWMVGNIARPFVDDERNGESIVEADYQPKDKYWAVTQIQNSNRFTVQNKGKVGKINGSGTGGGQSVRYEWASPGGDKATVGGIHDHPIFGLNNCNPGVGYGGSNLTSEFGSIYRSAPEDGTYAVLDEYKISRREAMLAKPTQSKDRVTRNSADKPAELVLSRYYMPPNPSNRSECPTFTSQTLLQSLKGYDKKTSSTPQTVTLARVSWNVFTPRFLHQDKVASRFSRPETVVNSTRDLKYRGPFDYCRYNGIINKGSGELREEFDDSSYNSNANIVPYRCARPTKAQYLDSALNPNAGDYKNGKPGEEDYHATRGVEIEVLEDSDDNAANGGGKSLGAGPFTNPNIINRILNGKEEIHVRSDRLRYLVRFRYPVDTMVDPTAPQPVDGDGKKWVDPENQYLLDTPVFDDISITYFTTPRILDYREINE